MDLNADVGEGFPDDEELLEVITSANICCGAHAGSPDLTFHTIDRCRSRGVGVGLHPGFSDRKHMGRRRLGTSQVDAACESLVEQVARLVEFNPPDYIKPHGAFYQMLCSPTPEERASGIWETLWLATDTMCSLMPGKRLPLLLLANSPGWEYANASGWRVFKEGFADRRTNSNGELISRQLPNAILHDPTEIEGQVLRLAHGVDSLCVHGDNPECVAIAKCVRGALTSAGFELRRFT